MGWLPLTNNDFQTHRAPMPAPHMTGPITCPFVPSTEEPCLSYAINDNHDAFWSDCAKRTQSKAAILAGNTPLRPSYRTAARSGFAGSTAPAPQTKALFRSARLGSTIPLGRYASPRPTPASSKPQLDHSPSVAPPVLQTIPPDDNASAAAEPLLNTLLSYSHCDWKQAAHSRGQPFKNFSVSANSRQLPTPRMVTITLNESTTPWQIY